MKLNNKDEIDKKIIKLLEKFPHIEDERSKDDVYQRVKNGMQRKKKKAMVLPALAMVAVVSLFAFTTPMLIQQYKGKFNTEQAKQEDFSIVSEEKADRSIQTKRNMDRSESEIIQSSEEPNMITSVYNEEIQTNAIVTLGVVTADAIVIPISIRTEEIQRDWLSTFKASAQLIDWEALGFKDLSPLLSAMSYDQDRRILHVKITSNNEEFFLKYEKQIMEMIEYTVGLQDVEKVAFINGENEPVELGAFGIIPNLDLRNKAKKAYYLYKQAGMNASSYLVPFKLESAHFSDAVANMKKPPNDFYQTLIPKEVTFSAGENVNGEALIAFNERLLLDEGDVAAKIRMIEGMLLTAKEYGYKTVQFENIEPLVWQGFDFNRPIDVPYSANLTIR